MGREGSYSSKIWSACFCVVMLAESIFFMPCTYLPKLLRRAASIGALSTATTSLIRDGDCNAKVSAVFAPLLCLSDHISLELEWKI